MQQQVIGKRRENVSLREIGGEDPWAESPFFSPTLETEIESEFIKPWNPGIMICGIFKGNRIANKKGPVKDQRAYAVFEDDDGNKFRVYTPGQLRHNLETEAKVGDYVEMEYLGKEEVPDVGLCHQFKFRVLDQKLN